ncbi:MFS transporter [Lacipirellula sp.]|uniref:MFS transporter n=1 Tax=Lacipirellula sp. TaxID=2691419 RepID=UPI003D10538A
MAQDLAASGGQRGKWMALLAALLGWMFDGFEIGMFPLVGPNALKELLADELSANPAAKDQWFGVIMAVFLIGAATGGVVFGWLGDRIGRVRAMSLSILTYAIFTGLCGFATQAWHIAALRFVASLGMGGEWSLGVALVTELWPNRSRAFLAGLIGAAANVGFLAVGLLSLVLVNFIQGFGEFLSAVGLPEATVQTLLHGDGWRLLMIAGALPALLVFFIRLFVPESRKWEAAASEQETSYWATQDLLGVVVGAFGAAVMVFLWSPAFDQFARTLSSPAEGSTPPNWLGPLRILATGIGFVAALVGYIYPVVRYLGRAHAAGQLTAADRRRNLNLLLLGACLAGIPLLGTWGSFQWAPKWAIALANQLPVDGGPYHAKEYAQIAASLGAIIGTILAALAGGAIGRRPTYVILCIGSFASLVYLYLANDAYGSQLLASIFVAGGVTAAFYGWFPLYLPELFPTSIRATSQGFAYNFGRVLSAVGSLQTAVLTAYFARNIPAERVEVEAFPRAGATLAAIYLVGVAIIWLGPETKGKPLPD